MLGRFFTSKKTAIDAKDEKKPAKKSATKKQLGDIGEQCALDFLLQQGLELIKRNFFSRFGEIDLVMLHSSKLASNTKQTYLVFIEVRRRKNLGYGTALESINFAKQTKLRKTADYFLIKNLQYSSIPARFDVILIPATNSKDSIEWIQNAF